MNPLTLSPEVKSLIELANKMAPPDQVEDPDPEWHNTLSSASADALVGLVSLSSSGRTETSRERKALREAAIAQIERKNAKAIIDRLHSLDRATSTFDKLVLWLTLAGVLLAVAQVIVAIMPLLARVRR